MCLQEICINAVKNMYIREEKYYLNDTRRVLYQKHLVKVPFANMSVRISYNA